ncbi:MAG: AMP-binding protein [Desulfovibrionales bacterium]
MFKRFQPETYDQFLSRYEVNIPDSFNFALDFLDVEAKNDPERIGMVHIDPQGTRRDFDLAFFSRESSRLAGGLRKLGISKGDRVMLILYRRVEFWIAMLALHKLGAVAVPSPALLTAHDISFRVQSAGIKAAIVEDSVSGRVVNAHADCPSLHALIQVGGGKCPEGWHAYEDVLRDQPEAYAPSENKPGGTDPLLIFFSSGTTGMPKMVEHTHTYPLGHLTTGLYWHDLHPGDLHLTLADTGWGKAVWGKFYGQWMAGASVLTWDFRGKFEPMELLSILADTQTTSFCAPPTVYRFLIRQDFSGIDLSALRHCTTAGELLNESVFHSWKEKTGLSIYEGYGQTETVLQLATFPFMKPKPGSIGKPVPGWDILLLDENGQPCPSGEEGEICVKADPAPVGLFTGYMDEPQKTAAAFRNGYYRTGDKAWMDEDGYFWFLGRTDDLIKSSGYRIGPFEVESALLTHPAVVEAAVTGVPDSIRGQAVKATVVLAEDFFPSPELITELQDHVKKVTAPYKYPRIVEFVPELPKTISGKIKRAEIRERDLNKTRN